MGLNKITHFRCGYLIFGIATLLLGSAKSGFSLPKDGNIVAGSGTISQTAPGTLEIQQDSSRLVTDWRSFDIGATESVSFKQPSTDAIALNRITGNDPTQIFGKLSANGNLFLINPNGILFGSSSQVDVNGLVATTIDIDNQDFMAGRYDFNNSPPSSKTIVNRGTITAAEGGLVAFVAPAVENSGIISAQLGRVSLASGSTFTLDLYGDKLINLGVDSKVLENVVGPDGKPVTSLVNNSGKINANGGIVYMDVNAAKGIVDNVINMTGFVEAKTAKMVAGEIILGGGDAGVVNITGTLDASGSESGQTGGTVQALGEKVGLFENAIIDVSGDAGGGTVLIGGDYRGQGDVQSSFRTYFDSEATVKADATGSGDGGKVIVWSDDTTRFFGDISVRGGSGSGNGGFVEVSGKEKLIFEGSVDLEAINGTAGTLLLDPDRIFLVSGSDVNSTGFTAGVDNTQAFADDAGLDTDLNVDGGGSFNGIADGATIILQADDRIELDDPFNIATATGSNNVNLVLQAGDRIRIDAALTADGTGTIHLEADSPHSVSNDGAGELRVTDNLTTAGGNVTLIGASFDLATGTVNSGAGDINIAQSQSSQALGLGTGGNLLLSDAKLDSLSTTGTLTIGQAITKGTDGAGTGAVTLTAGAITLDELTQGTKNITLISNSTINDDDDTGAAIATTGTLTLTSGGEIGNLGGTQGLDTDISTLVITSTGGNTAKVDNGTTNLDLGTITTGGGAFGVRTGGSITDSGVLTVGGTAIFTTDVANQSITLDTTTNALTGAIDFTTSGTGDVTLDNGTAATNLRTVSVGQNLAVTAGEAITDSGVLTVGGTASFTTDVASKSITLDTATNAITGAVSFSTTSGGLGAGNVTFDNGTTATNLGTVSVGDDLSVTAGEAITDSGVLTVGGTSSFTTDVANKSITLDTTTNALTGAISFSTTGTGDVTLDNGTTATDLGTVSVGQNLAVTAGAAISQSGILTVGGTGSFITDTANNSIVLLNSSNAVTGTVSFSTTGTGDVRFDNGTTALDLGTVSVGDFLTVRTGNAITDSGVLTVGGNAIFTSNVVNNSIILDTTTNAITGGIGFFASGTGDVTLDNGTTATTLDTVTVGQNLTVTAGNVITQTGTLVVGGTSSFTTDVANQSITLDRTSNDLTGAVSFSTTGTGDVTLDNGTTATNLGTVSVGQNLAVTAGEAITDSGVLTVGGTSSFTTDVANKSITLNTTTNALTGAVSFSTTGTGDASLINNTSTILDASTVGDVLTVEATGAGSSINVNGSQTATSIILTAVNDILHNSGTLTVSDGLVMQAGDGITIDSAVTATGTGTVHLEADSPHSASNDGTGQLSIRSTVTTAGRAVTLIGAVFGFGSGTVNSGAGNINLARSQDNLAFSLSTGDTSLDQLFTTGTLTIGQATTKGTDGLGTGAITLTAGAITVDNLTQDAKNITLISNSTINDDDDVGAAIATTGTLTLTSGGAIGTAVDGEGLNIDVATLVITSTDGNTAKVDNGTTNLDLGTINTGAGAFAVRTGGSITDSGVLTVAGNSSFITDEPNKSITLDTSTNDLSGRINFTTSGTGDVTLDNGTRETNLGTVSVGRNLSVTSGGAIVDVGVLTVGGTASFTTDAANRNINLNTSTNAITGAISFSTTGTGDVTLDNGTTATNLGTVSVGQNLVVTAGEAITDSGVLTVGGTSSFTTDVANKSITLDTSTNALTGAVSFSTTGTGDVNLDNGTTAINLGTVSVGRNLVVAADGAISDSGVLTVGGTARFLTEGVNNSVTLDTSTNAITGAIDFTTAGTGDVTLDNGTTATNLGTVSVGQNLAVTAGEAITDSGVLTVGGTASFTTDVANKSITLDTATNAITGAVSFSNTGTGDASLINNTSTILAASTVGDVLTVEATGVGSDININGSQTATSIILTAVNDILHNSGTLTVSDSLVMQAGDGITTGSAITATGTGTVHLEADSPHSASNDGNGFLNTTGNITTAGGEVTLIGATLNFGIGTTNAGAGNINVAQSQSNLAFDLTIPGADGSIDQLFTTGTITVGQATTKGTDGAGTGAVTLTAGAITVDNLTQDAKNITLVSNSTINDDDDVGAAIATTGVLTLTSGGAIGNLGGAQGLDTDVSTLVITSTGGNNATIDNGTTNLDLGNISTGVGNFSATTGGTIIDSGVLTVGGTSSFTTDVANQSITLDTTTNALTGAISFSTTGTGDVTLDNGTTATNLGTVNVGQNLDVTAGNVITDSGVLTVGGTSSFTTDVANQSITLDTTTNALTGAISFSTTGTGDVTLDNGTTATNLGAVNVGQNLDVTAGNAITDSGVLTVGGTSSFTTDVANQSITLDTTTNALTGAISFSTTGTGDVTLDNGTTATNLGTVTVGQNLAVTAGNVITDSGVLTVGGTSSLTTDVANQSITLDTVTNALTGSVTLSTSGTGNASLTNNTSTVLSASTVGRALTLNATGSGSSINVSGSQNAASILLTADDDIVLNSGTLTASDSGNSLILATTNGGDFTNNVGAGVLAAASGRWLIYSTDPATTTLGGLTPDQTAFNTTFSTIPGSFGASDNGLLYSIAQNVVPPIVPPVAPPVAPPTTENIIENLETSEDPSTVRYFNSEYSLVISEQRSEMEALISMDIEELLRTTVEFAEKEIKNFSLVETYNFLDFGVLNKMDLEELMQIFVEPIENISNKLSFVETQRLLEDELMLTMKPEDLMKIKMDQIEKEILKFSILEPENDSEVYVGCVMNAILNTGGNDCVNRF